MAVWYRTAVDCNSRKRPAFFDTLGQALRKACRWNQKRLNPSLGWTEAVFPRCHSVSSHRGQSLPHTLLICAAVITGAVSRFPLPDEAEDARPSLHPSGEPSGVHSLRPHAPPSHSQRLPLPCCEGGTTLHRRFRFMQAKHTPWVGRLSTPFFVFPLYFHPKHRGKAPEIPWCRTLKA